MIAALDLALDAIKFIDAGKAHRGRDRWRSEELCAAHETLSSYRQHLAKVEARWQQLRERRR